MIRIKKLLSNRLVAPAAVALAALAMLLNSSSPATAAIYWDRIQMVDQGTQQCLAAEGVAYVGASGTEVSGCMANGTGWIWLVSARPDSSDTANVWIQTVDPSGTPICLEAQNPGAGPNGPWSAYTQWDWCNSGNDSQVWTMQTAAPSQDVGNPAGLKHFINFYNSAQNECLDGGIGAYGLAGSCSTTNNWQIWNIYTNQTSGPYHG